MVSFHFDLGQSLGQRPGIRHGLVRKAGGWGIIQPRRSTFGNLIIAENSGCLHLSVVLLDRRAKRPRIQHEMSTRHEV